MTTPSSTDSITPPSTTAGVVEDVAGQPARKPLMVLRPTSSLSMADLSDLWEYRELLGILAWRDLSIRYKQAVFGVLWALVQPMLQVVLFTLLFHRIGGLQAQSDTPYSVFVMAGIAPWSLFANGVLQASDSLVRNGNLVTKVYFPRVLIPLSTVLVTLIDFAVAVALLFVMMAYYHLPITPRALLVVPLGLLATLITMGSGLWLSALNAEFRDIRYALPFLMQMMWYVAPVFYPTTAIPARFRPYVDLNPMAACIDGFRAALFGGPFPAERLLISLSAGLVLCLSGYLVFRQFERTFVDRM